MTQQLLRKTDLPEPAEITKMVDEQERETETLRKRFEADYDLLQLKDVGKALSDGDLAKFGKDGFRTYVSNGPQTYANKIISWLSSSKLQIRMPYGRAVKERRVQLDKAERVFYGMLHSADERLERMMMLPLQDQLAAYIPIRGRYCGRALLVKDPEDGSTYVDITPWDPLMFHWRVGPNGLLWACHKTLKTVSEVEAEYGLVLEGRGASTENGEPEIEVYDWYNFLYNMVVIDNLWAKPPTPHGSTRTPVFSGVVGPMPFIRSRKNTGRDTSADYGDSIFRSNRDIYPKLDFMMSVMLHLAALARNRAHTYESRDGTRKLDNNPYLEGAEVHLAEGEKLELLPLLETGRDMNSVIQLMIGEIQRGSIPFTAYGELNIAISGYAIKLLNQGMEAPMSPLVKAMESAYLQICTLLMDQYTTGYYGEMDLSGVAKNRQWFQEVIGPDDLMNIGRPTVRLKVDMPQDEAGKMQVAQLARQPGTDGLPLLPDTHIRDVILEIEDVDVISDEINEQAMKSLLPAAKLLTLMKSAIEREDFDMFQLYAQEFMKLQLMPMPSPQNGPGNGKNGGMSPETLPTGQARGGQPAQFGPSGPPDQAGPNVPPGTPRPGAQGK